MGIDVNSLPPWAQKQIAQKWMEQERRKLAKAGQSTTKPESNPNTEENAMPFGEEKIEKRKYHNKKAERILENGKVIHFDSQKEARRFDDLLLLWKAGEIYELKLQPQFTLQESYITPEGVRVQAIKYVADFSYNTGNGSIVEDVKSNATKTRVYGLKKKLMLEKFGITVTEV